MYKVYSKNNIGYYHVSDKAKKYLMQHCYNIHLHNQDFIKVLEREEKFINYNRNRRWS